MTREKVCDMRAKWRSLAVVVLALAGVVLLGVSGSVTSMVSLAAVTALIMGGTFNPVPSQAYIDAQADNYITGPGFFGLSSAVGVTTPEEFWPLNGSTLTFDESVAQGVDDLDAAMGGYSGQQTVVLGYSQSTRIASIKKRQIIDEHGDDFGDYPDVGFVLVADVNKGNGGILERFNGLVIPILGVTFDGAIPTDSPQNPDAAGDYALDTKDITFIHDGWSDFPIYPLNLLAVANAVLGIAYLHSSYPALTDPELVEQGSYGDTDYYVIGTDIVPLLRPLEQIGIPKPILLAVDEPLRVMIEAGYRRDINPGVPTPAYLIPIINPISYTVNLLSSVPVGLDDAAQEMGMGRPLGTQPSGVYGVGGDDADLAGLPPGLIPLGKQTSSESAAVIIDSTADTHKTEPVQDDQVTTLSVPEGDAAGQAGDDSVGDGTQDADGAQPDAAGTPAVTPKPDRPKVLRPKIRGPIQFDRPELADRGPSAGGPIGRALDALSGQRPEPSPETGDPTERVADKPAERKADRPATRPAGKHDRKAGKPGETKDAA